MFALVLLEKKAANVQVNYVGFSAILWFQCSDLGLNL